MISKIGLGGMRARTPIGGKYSKNKNLATHKCIRNFSTTRYFPINHGRKFAFYHIESFYNKFWGQNKLEHHLQADNTSKTATFLVFVESDCNIQSIPSNQRRKKYQTNSKQSNIVYRSMFGSTHRYTSRSSRCFAADTVDTF